MWCHRDARDTVLGLIEAYHSQQVDRENGRPGMTFWHILVVAVMKQGLDVDDDRLANLMSHHMALRNLVGLPHFVEKTRLSAATLANKLSLLSDEVLAKIKRVIVQLGHQAVGHQVDDILKARGDRHYGLTVPARCSFLGSSAVPFQGGETKRHVMSEYNYLCRS